MDEGFFNISRFFQSLLPYYLDSISTGTNFSDLPEELLFDIFTRLPVRSIIRLRCVCKSFYTLTRTRRFVSHHLKHNKIRTGDSTWLEDHGNHFLYSKIGGFSNSIYELLPANKLFPPFMEIQCLVLAHCNGLFCLTTRRTGTPLPILILYNPATRESRFLPPSNFDTPPYKVPLPTQYSFGFGFDPKTEDYKVIKIVVLKNKKKNKSGSHIQFAEVYSLGTNSWRIIEQVLCDIPIYHGHFFDQTNTVYANGAVHWFANRSEKNTILSFDTNLEVFRETLLIDKYLAPRDFIRDYLYNDCTLWLLNDQLVIICGLYIDRWGNRERQTSFQAWVLNSNYEDRPWSNFMTVEEPILGIWKSLGFWKNGEIIFAGSSGPHYSMDTVRFYDPDTKEVRDLKHSGKIDFIYRESLVPLKLHSEDDYLYQYSTIDYLLLLV